jgi:phage terminase small subunit
LSYLAQVLFSSLRLRPRSKRATGLHLPKKKAKRTKQMQLKIIPLKMLSPQSQKKFSRRGPFLTHLTGLKKFFMALQL